MKLLFVEDEKYKANEITEFLEFSFDNITIDVAKSYTAGINFIRQNTYDYLLLDMSLPLYDWSSTNSGDQNEFETFAGLDILDEMDRLQIDIKTIRKLQVQVGHPVVDSAPS